MSTFKSSSCQSYATPPVAYRAGEEITVKDTYSLATSSASALAASDVVYLVYLPADHVPVKAVFWTGAAWDKSSAASGGNYAAGVFDASSTTSFASSGDWFSTDCHNTAAVDNTEQLTKSSIAVINKVFGLTASTKDRYVGMKLGEAPSNATSSATEVGCQLTYRRATSADY